MEINPTPNWSLVKSVILDRACLIRAATAAAMFASIALVITPASAAVVTLTCTQTGAANTPFSLTINNSDDEVIQATAKDCGGALTIPVGVRKIGFGAFVPWTQDGTNSPMTNANITSISISSTVTHIHVGGFINLTNVQALHIPGNVISVVDQAFQGMTSLQTVTIDGSPTSTPTFLGRYAFNEDSIDLVLGSGKIDLGVDFGAGSTIRSVNLGTGLVSIGTSAFQQQQFSDLTIPPSVTTIGARAFRGMPNLREVKFGPSTPGITSIDDTAFSETNITAIQYCGGNAVVDAYITAQLPNADVYCNASTAPNAPTITNVVAGNGTAAITFTPGADNDGPATTNYKFQYSLDSLNWSSFVLTPASLNTTINVPSLTNGTSYVFRVAGISSAGAGNYSATSSAVTPQAPVLPTTTTTLAPTTTSTTTTTLAPTSTSTAPFATPTTTLAPSPTPVTTIAQGQASVATIAPSVSRPATPVIATTTTTTTLAPAITPLVNNAAISAESNTVAMVEKFIGVSTKQVSTLAEQADVDRGAAIIVDGQVLPVETNTTISSATLTYLNASLTVQCFDKDGKVLQLSGESRFVVRKGDVVRVTLSGFKPNTQVNFAMFSNPTALGTVTADAIGSGRQQWQIPNSISPGNHTLVATGNLPNIGNTTFGLRVIIDSKSLVTRISSSNSARALLVGGILIGLVLPATRRRRRIS